VQKHHLRPVAWGGQRTPQNEREVCGTTHDAVHALLNESVRRREFPDEDFLKGYPRAAVEIARAGVQAHLEATGGQWPTRFTSGDPSGEASGE
jgi:hypothetical protein